MAGAIRAVKGFLAMLVITAIAIVVWRSGLIDGSQPTDAVDRSGDVEPASETAEVVDAQPVELVRVIDGDSLEVVIDGDEVDVRIEGVNAPELFGNDGRKCNGEAAKEALDGLVDGQRLLLVGDEVDRFGRRLGDVLIDDGDPLSVAFALVRSGHALSTGNQEPSDGGPSLRDTMKQAAAAERGFWGEACGSRDRSALSLGATQVDPPGSDRDNLNDEWVTVRNDGTTAVELTGWVLSDDTTGHRFTLEGELGPGAVLTVRSGAGSSTAADLYLGESFPVWSNRGETVLLTNPDGVISTWLFVDP